MMSVLVLLLALGVGLVVAFVVWRLIASIRGSHRRTGRILQEINPVMEALGDGQDPSNQDLVRFASHPRTRNTLLLVLQEHGKEGLFPQEYRTAKAIAEGDLVFWLCHPNELQSAPDEIELIGKFPKELGSPVGRVDYYLFRFRVTPPHWAADDGWMAGVAGPYREGQTVQPWQRAPSATSPPSSRVLPKAMLMLFTT